MFDIGFWELLVVGLIGLIILGPERLPRAIRSLQATLNKVRHFGSRMEAEINHELRVKELHENLKKIEQADDMENLPDDLKRSLAELQKAAQSVNRPYAKAASQNDGDNAEHHSAQGHEPDDGSANDAVKPANAPKEPGNDRTE